MQFLLLRSNSNCGQSVSLFLHMVAHWTKLKRTWKVDFKYWIYVDAYKRTQGLFSNWIYRGHCGRRGHRWSNGTSLTAKYVGTWGSFKPQNCVFCICHSIWITRKLEYSICQLPSTPWKKSTMQVSGFSTSTKVSWDCLWGAKLTPGKIWFLPTLVLVERYCWRS